MYAHPGKKLLFMGQEFAQFIEWNYEQELDWMLLGYEMHERFHGFIKSLNTFYKKTPAMWQIEDSWDGFAWISADDSAQNILAFTRTDKSGASYVVVCNFSPVERQQYMIGAPRQGSYKLVFDSSWSEFGGHIPKKTVSKKSTKTPMHGFDQSLCLDIPPMSVMYFKAPEAF